MAIIINCNQSSRLALCFLALAFCGLASIVDCRHLLQQEGGEVIRSVRSVDTQVDPPICVLDDVKKSDQFECCGLSVLWQPSGDRPQTGVKDIYLSYSDGPENTERAICFASAKQRTKSDCVIMENSNITGFSVKWTCSSAQNCNNIDDKIRISVYLRKGVNIDIPSFKCQKRE